MPRHRRLLWLIITGTLTAWTLIVGLPANNQTHICYAGQNPDSQPELDFETHIRPLLVEKCQSCHTSDEKSGGLDLSSATGWKTGGDSGPAINLEVPAQSLLLKAVDYQDPHLQMPPDGKLSDREIERIRAWIARGAFDPREAPASQMPIDDFSHRSTQLLQSHWAYQPLLVAPTHASIDQLLAEPQQAAGLSFNPSATAETLVRRLFFDVTGLPAAPDELVFWSQKIEQGEYETLVDHLLSSPAYAEHFARHWLDLVRYAESLTLRGLTLPHAWRYRDYVVSAFQQDMGYDQFIHEQLAGDLLEADHHLDRARQEIATTFLALGNSNLEEQDKIQLEMDIVDEQLNVIGHAFLGQTITCARCHDHKFDPISTKDYYALAGIFANLKVVNHANVSTVITRTLAISDDERAVFEALDHRKNELTKARKKLANELDTFSEQHNGQIQLSDLQGIVIDSDEAIRVGSWKQSTHLKPFLGSGYLYDNKSEKSEKTLTFLPDLKSPGEYDVRLAYSAHPDRATAVLVRLLHAEGDTEIFVDQSQPAAVDQFFVSLGRYRFEAGNQGAVIVSSLGAKGYVTADAVQFVPVGIPPVKRTSIASTSQETELKFQIQQTDHELSQITIQLSQRPKGLGFEERPDKIDVAVNIRGNVHSLGEVVPRGMPRVGGSAGNFVVTDNESGRKQLALWLTDQENTLTARVMTNRIWCWIMGEGLVRSPDNLGTTGQLPTNQLLLDHLAREFREQGWSVKAMVKTILMSQAYRQSSDLTEHQLDRDPENLLWGRSLKKRLTAEALRDTLLAVSGHLDRQSRPQTPSIKSDYGYRYQGNCKSLYVPVFRNSLPDLYEVFDFPETSMPTSQRTVSTIPSQGLYLLNSEFVSDQARGLAGGVIELEHETFEQRLQWAFQVLYSRSPRQNETELARDFFNSEGHDHGQPDELKRWELYVHALMAAPEFRYYD